MEENKGTTEFAEFQDTSEDAREEEEEKSIKEIRKKEPWTPRPNLEGFKRLLKEEEGIITEDAQKSYKTLDDLIEDINNNPPDNIEKIEQYEIAGLLPLMIKGEGKNTKIIFGLRYNDRGLNKPRDTYQFSSTLKSRVLKFEKIPQEIKREYLLLSSEEITRLEAMTYGQEAKEKREIRLGIPQKEKFDEDTQAIKAYQIVIRDAIRLKSSDIHLEPYAQGQSRVRFRIDGVLREQNYEWMNKERLGRLIQTIKGQTNMDVSEHRRPQDGSITLRTKEEEKENQREIVVPIDRPKRYNLRVSTAGTNHGEKAVLRILEAKDSYFDLEKLGYPRAIKKEIDNVIRSPYGIILMTGPTGSGKTTSLYSMLNELNTPEVNITTIEDPIEIYMQGFNQLSLNTKIGVDFSTCLRSILRQDPDIIFIGEIRDKETAEIAVQAAKTGHLVFSTIHTNDAIGTMLRLQDFSIYRRDLSNTLRAAVSQRLVRKLCPQCREDYNGGEELNRIIGEEEFIKNMPALWRPGKKTENCEYCKGVGYRGRKVVPELWTLGAEERALIDQGNTNHDDYLRVALKKGMYDLMYSSIRLAIAGSTTLEELFREVISPQEIVERKEYLRDILPRVCKELSDEKNKPGDTSLPNSKKKTYKK
jgi:type IV pilus assembly protein PilB